MIQASVWSVITLSRVWDLNTTNTERYALCNSQRLQIKFLVLMIF